MRRRRYSVRALAAVSALAVATSPLDAQALTANELFARVRAATGESRSLARQSWSYRAEQALVDRVDALADDFHELAASGSSLAQTSSALVDLIDETRQRYTAVLEAMQAEVIRLDGDLEAVQDSEGWRERELLAMRLRYRLNWVEYETAMRYERNASKRKHLLTDARDGFAEFMATGDLELANESLLGHGLASKALKDYDTAVRDFRAALAQNPAPDLANKLRIGLAEVSLATGQIESALDATATLVANTSGDDRTQALFLRAKTLLLSVATRRYGGSSQGARMREAAGVLEDLYKRGGYWRSKVVQLVDSGVDEPGAWAKVGSSPFVTWLIADSLRRRAECARAIDLYDALLQQSAFEQESMYGTGYCSFQEGRYDLALERLGEFMEAAGDQDPNYEQSAYLRFKSAESLYLKADESERDAAAERYVALMREFLEKAPEHRYAFEAWFRLGEWHRDRALFTECADAFAKVAGDPAFEIKAKYLAAQCRVEAVLATPDDAEPPLEIVRAALASIDTFLAKAATLRTERPAGQADLLAPLEAKAVVMGAAIVTRAGAGTMADRLTRLRGFADRFPAERELLPEVHSLRVVAFTASGDLDRAGEELEALLAFEGSDAYRYQSLKKLGVVFLKEASRREDAGDGGGATRSRRVALRVYRRLLDDVRSGKVVDADASVDGLERLVADLESQAGAS